MYSYMCSCMHLVSRHCYKKSHWDLDLNFLFLGYIFSDAIQKGCGFVLPCDQCASQCVWTKLHNVV